MYCMNYSVEGVVDGLVPSSTMWGLAPKAVALRLGVQAPLALVDTEEIPVGGYFPENGGVNGSGHGIV